MSEYQYYEFQAVDRPLTAEEREYISSLSSRTEATLYSASFVYHYTGLSANEEQLLAKYFDAFLYLANWGTARLLFRFPKSAIDIEILKPYCYLDSIEVKTYGNYIIFDMTLNQEEGFDGWLEGEGLLPQMIELRQDILQGDMRAPYLAWLKIADMEADYMDEAEDLPEPPVPPNLKKRSRALTTFMEFFYLDEDLVRAAAETSLDAEVHQLDIAKGIEKLSAEEKDNFLQRLAKGERNINIELVNRLRQLTEQKPASSDVSTGRTITQIRERVEFFSEERLKEQRRQAEERRKKAEAKRQKYLNTLVDKVPKLWDKVFYLISEKRTKPYEEAIEILTDLRDISYRDAWSSEFQEKINLIYEQYPTLRGLHTRMEKRGFSAD